MEANDRSGSQKCGLAQGRLDKLEGPKYAARRAELSRKPREAARARDRQAAAASQREAEESDETEDEATREGPTNESGRTARWHEGCSENRRGTAKRDRKEQTLDACRRCKSDQ